MPEIFEGFIVLSIAGVALVVFSEVCLCFFSLRQRLKKRRQKPQIRFLDD
ncbi:MAG: hypothetical protein HDQ93_03605 [Desulfovibrio sp.]|nr:hypothetical protein [Desulfovibrio sp.]